MKRFLLSFVALLAAIGTLKAQEPELVYECLFGASYNDSKVGSYTATWTATNEGTTWTIGNFNNNNNGWAYVKCGRKGSASTGYITSPVFPESISKVVVTIDAITASSVNSISLLTSSSADSADEDWTPVVSKTGSTELVKGDMEFILPSPQSNLAYKLRFDCASASSNGPVQVSKVDYYAIKGDPTLEPAGLKYNETEVNVTKGESYTLPTLSNPYDLAVTYTSTNEAVATVDAEGNVTIVGLGTTTIKATSDETDKYNAGEASYTLTVSLQSIELAFDGTGVVNYDVAKGAEFTAPTLHNPSNVPVTYTSSDPNVAAVDENGNITIGNQIGTTTITASFAGNDTYEAATAEYTISVYDPNASSLVFKDITSVADSIKVGSATVTISKGSGSTVPALYPTSGHDHLRIYAKNEITVTVPEGYQLDLIEFIVTGSSYKLSASCTAGTFNATDQVWTAGADEEITEVTFTNTSSSQARFSEIKISYSEVDSTLQPADLAFAEQSVEAIYGQAVPENALTNPHDLPVTWTSSNENVATVDENGNITLVNAGTTTITAASEATDEYRAGSASYTLTVIREFKASSIAELNELVEADASAEYEINFATTVTYTNGAYTYLTDGTDFMVVYQNNLPYTALDIIPAGWTAAYKLYNGLPEFSFVGSHPAAEAEKGTFSPRTITVDEAVDLKNIGEVVIIKNVNFTSATPENHTSVVADGITFYNQFGIATTAAGVYTVECVVSRHNEDYQYFPIAYTSAAPDLSQYTIKINGEEVTDGSTLEFTDEATVEFPTVEGISFYYKWTPSSANSIMTADETEDGYTKYTDPITLTEQGNFSYYAQDDATGAKSDVKTLAFDIETGVAGIEAAEGEAAYFNLQGVKVANPERGIYIRILNGKATKVILND